MNLENVKQFWREKPLQSIIIIALVLRLLAALFSQGFGMHDDHFLVIEASQSWADGTDYNDWLPKTQKAINPNVEPIPSGHSFFYVGIHYVFFSTLNFLGIDNPKIKMLIIRLIHAFFSLIVVILGFKITRRLSNDTYARQVGLILASLWAMPFLSVRNLVEVVAVPFLLMGLWRIIQAEGSKKVLVNYMIAGLIMGIGFSVRFQTILFIGGVGLVLLFRKAWKEAITFGIGALISMLAIQGLVDYFVWGKPFVELTEYIKYNIMAKDAYGTNNFFMYFELIPGLLIPPIGVFLFLGFFFAWKKHLIFFLPVFIFFAFHTLFPNKQERFALTILPFFIIIGLIGWNEWIEKSKFWQQRQKLMKGCWTFFWIVNLILLPIFTLTYSKKSRIEAMYYFYKKEPIKQILIEDTNRSGAQMLPDFYAGQWIVMHTLTKQNNIDSTLFGNIKTNWHYYKELYDKQYYIIHPEMKPQYVLFLGNLRLDERVADIKPVFPNLELVKVSEPGFIDNVLHKLNPVNKNETIYIYKTN